jgi:hypothetical protein
MKKVFKAIAVAALTATMSAACVFSGCSIFNGADGKDG